MTLIIILIAMLFEHFVGIADDIRRFGWFEQYVLWLENRYAHYKSWNGPTGVIASLILPLLLVILIDIILAKYFLPAGFLFALAILTYSLGPAYLDPILDDYINAIDNNDADKIDELTIKLVESSTDSDQLDEQQIIEDIMIQANDRLFAVLFWFLLLGPVGAILYRLASQLRMQHQDIHGSYSDSARDLYNILNWPSARLFSIGSALSGNLVDAIEAWREVERDSLQVNEQVIKASGMGALHYRPKLSPDDEELPGGDSYWFRSVQGLVNRTLIIWLTALGLMTIAGWMG